MEISIFRLGQKGKDEGVADQKLQELQEFRSYRMTLLPDFRPLGSSASRSLPIWS